MSKVNNNPKSKTEQATKSKKPRSTTTTRSKAKPATKNKTSKGGRPKGSKNKPKVSDTALTWDPSAPGKRILLGGVSYELPELSGASNQSIEVKVDDTTISMPIAQPETTTTNETNDRLSAVYDHTGTPEPKSVPRPKTNQAVVSGDSVVMAEPAPEPMQAISKMDLPKPQAMTDGQSVVMETKPDVIEPAPKPEKAAVKNEAGVLIVQEPVRTTIV